jgi:thiamine biosynthesis lipoprotein
MELNQQERSVRLTRSGMLLDLGSIGKGYALDRAVEILRDEEVRSGLIHGGTSTVSAWGKAPDQGAWKVCLAERPAQKPSIEPARETSDELEKLGAVGVEDGKIIELHDESLSMSAVWGKAFVHDNVVLGHVLDPRTGQPVRGDTLAAAVAMRSATDSDALATALLVMGPEGRRRIQERFPESRVWC